jgi:dienelactone hydrolase
MKFRCPKCEKVLKAGEDRAGSKAQCPRCGTKFRLPAPSAPTAPRPAAPAPSAAGQAAAPAPPTPLRPVAKPVCSACGAVVAGAGPCDQCGYDPVQGPVVLRPVVRRKKRRMLVAWAGLGALAFLIVVTMLVVGLKKPASTATSAAPPMTAEAAKGSSPSKAAASASFAPARVMNSVQPGVRWSETRVSNSGRPGDGGRIWIYLPAGSHPPRSLACVLIAPAGSNLASGMDLGEGDQQEHYPYAQAGFAVVAYELDGPMSDRPSVPEVRQALAKFFAAEAGLVNARNAILYARTQIPDVNPERIYVAGHSSAATVALLVAAQEPGIRGCVAFAPCTDVVKRLAGVAGDLERVLPGARQFLVRSSPLAHATEIRCPLLLFHAKDDANVPVDESRAFAEAVRKAGGDVRLEIVPRGGHYDAMIREGIPLAIQWLKQRVSAEQGDSPPAAATAIR